MTKYLDKSVWRDVWRQFVSYIVISNKKMSSNAAFWKWFSSCDLSTVFRDKVVLSLDVFLALQFKPD